MAKTATPVKVYPSKTLRGPAWLNARPIPRNRPVPIVPPRAINCMWRDLRLDESYQSCLRRTEVHQNNTWQLHLPTRDVTIFFGRLYITIHISGLTHPDALCLDNVRGIMVRRSIVAVGLLGLDVVRCLVHVEQWAG